ncbi:MAG: cyclic nucleotide-binding domain-containing protein [Alphaproteobacteria bacterium]|nr:cyclic nucleotide-binding domain-containing protein [Alphaproteobacteria bacterium]
MSDLANALGAHPFLAGLSDVHLAEIAACASDVRFTSGQVVAKEGRPADATYILRKGRVALKAGPHVVETVEDDEVLGWSWLFDGVWHVDAVAVGEVDAIRLDGALLDAAMHRDATLGHALSRRILLLVHRRLERARLRSLDVFGVAR